MDRTVEAVNDTAENIARFGIFFLDIAPHGLDERFVAGFVTLDDLARFFVDNDDVVVFVDYFHDDKIT